MSLSFDDTQHLLSCCVAQKRKDTLQTEYCVILCRRTFEFCQPYPRTRRFYVGAPTADNAILAASDTLPHYRPIGVELSDLPRFELDSSVEFPGAGSPGRNQSNRGLAEFANAGK
jgi:hypothetical protein